MGNLFQKGEKFFERTILRDAIREGEHQENAHFNMVEVPLNKEAASRLLPWRYKLTDPPIGTLYVTHFPKPNFTVTNYEEAAFWIHVESPKGGRYCCWMVVNDDTALILGREVLGLPKKMADFEYDETEGGVNTSVSRRGIKIFSADFKQGERKPHPEPILNRPLIHVGGMLQMIVFNPIWRLKGHEVLHEVYDAQATLNMFDSEFDPLAKLVSGPPIRAYMAHLDLLGTNTMFPTGLAGPKWFARNVSLRIR